VTPGAYAAFTQALLARLEADPRVLWLLSDDLDPFRRFEIAYPALGGELDSLIRRETPAAALRLLDLARRELAGRIPGFPSRAADVVKQRIEGL
jgi:hypothetical protein